MSRLVSIIMPTYNCAGFIGASIETAQAQDVTDWELVIVDDCSTDNTKEVVERYAASDDRILYHRLEKNSGAAVARTKAMELASGQYFALLDSDDLWMPDKLSRQLAFMRDNDIDFCCTAYEQMTEAGVRIGRVIKTRKKSNYNNVLLTCPIGNSSTMFNAARLGKFVVPDIRKRNDDALWFQILRKTEYIYGMPDVLMLYRLRSKSISRNKFTLIKYHWILYRDIEHLSVPRSVFHVCFWVLLKLLRIK